jgi:hypothetical protein
MNHHHRNGSSVTSYDYRTIQSDSKRNSYMWVVKTNLSMSGGEHANQREM